MKYPKLLGLAIAAAAALMAIAGAGTASATVLCHSTTTSCSEKWKEGAQLEFHVKTGTVGRWGNTNGETLVECAEGILKGKPSVGGESSTVTMSIEGESEFNWNNACGGSVITKLLEGGKLEIHSISGSDNGTVTATGFAFTTTFFGVTCTYAFNEPTDLGTLTGSGTGEAVLDINSVFTKKAGSFLCPVTATWTEEFTQTGPSGTALYVEPS
jgi:hypothetical protein